MSPTARETKMDAVECAVCLQPYDPKLAVPRVVACGHTFCEPCLSSLNPHPSFNSAVRCPLCSLIIPLPTTISSLPKNLELLRLSNPSLPIPAPKPPKTQITPEFLPLNFPDSFFSRWNPLILPQSSVSISIGAVSSRLGPPWCCDQNQRVSFFRIGVSPARFGRFRLSYAARVLNFLFGLGESARSELGLVIDASWRCRRGVCRVLGVWMDVDGVEEVEWGVYLVCERFNEGNFKFLEEREDGLVVGMEICEALMGLHSEKLVCGCLGKSCFGFDEFGHCVFDLHGLLVMARRVREDLKVENSLDFVGMGAFVSPEVLVSLSNANGASVGRFQGSCDCGADVWSLACMLILLIGGDALLEKESFEDFCSMLFRENDGYFTELLMSRYEIWRTKVNSKIEALIQGTKYEALIPILISSLSYHPENRPQVSDIWHCIRGLLGRTPTRVQACAGVIVAEEDSICCLTLADCPSLSKETDVPSSIQGDKSVSDNVFNEDMTGSKGEYLQPERFVTGLHGSGCKTMTLQGHHDCVTGLAIGGGFLFSSSFDRTVNVWSLQDLSHVQTLRGHEHKVLAILVVDSDETLCISGDYGSGICVWNIGGSIGHEPLKKWYEHNDWRYSGIHSLAFSGTGYLYSGSGDKSIKAWSLQDYTLSCTMTGHKSTVSSLAIADGILYSGSWDGTVRLWWLSDHSPLTTLEADTLGNLSPVLSLSVNDRVLVSSCENGTLNIWKDASHVKSSKIQSGSLFALDMDGKWVFAGGWDKIIDIQVFLFTPWKKAAVLEFYYYGMRDWYTKQELSDNDVQIDIKPTASISCDSIITSLLYWHGRLFVGLSDKEIKVLCAE